MPERKAGHSTAFPLSASVGEALVDYLRHGRPQTEERRVFFRAVAPVEPIGAARCQPGRGTTCCKAGIDVPRPGSHTLRHTCVQRLVDADFAFKTIGDFVGHRSARSTEIYAKVAVEPLRQVVLGGDGEEVLVMSHSETIELAVEQFLAHKRALGRKYHSEEEELRLLVALAAEHAALRLDDLTPALLDDFLRLAAPLTTTELQPSARRVGASARLGREPAAARVLAAARSPPAGHAQRGSRSCLTRVQARRLLDAAGALADNAHARAARPDLPDDVRAVLRARAARRRGVRAAAGRRRRATVICWWCAAASSARAVSFRTDRGSPRCSSEQLERRRPRRCGPRCRAAVHLRRRAQRSSLAPPARPSTSSSARSSCRCPTASRRRGCTACATASRSDACCAGIARGSTPPARLHQLSTFMGHVDPAVDRRLPDDHPGAAGRGQPPVRSVRRARLDSDGDGTMSPAAPLGQLLHSFFADHLITVKGLRPASVRSYRDTIRLLIVFLAADKRSKITRLTVGDLTFERIVAFLRHLEQDRGNHIRTRNQRLAVIHTLFEYIATRSPEMLIVCQQVAAIPTKRVPPPETRFLERDEIQASAS